MQAARAETAATATPARATSPPPPKQRSHSDGVAPIASFTPCLSISLGACPSTHLLIGVCVVVNTSRSLALAHDRVVIVESRRRSAPQS